MNNARLYVRVSHEEQAKFGLSIDTQIESLVNYCKQNNIKVLKIYKDEGISASSVKKRKAFVEMIEECQKGEIILFTKLDRFSRNLLDANLIVQELDKKGVSIKAINEDDIDTSNADGKFIFNLKLSLAQREIEKTSERIKDVFAYKIKQGEVIYGKKIFGYDKVGKRLVINQREANMLRDMFEYYHTHKSYTMTVKYWNKKYPDNKIELSYVKRRLKNTLYTGVYRTNEHFCEPIISKDLFDLVQIDMKNNYRTHGNKSVFIFSSLIICPCCGRRLAGNKQLRKYANKSKVYYLYRCNNYFLNAKCSNNKIINETNIEKYLLENINMLLHNYIVDVEKKTKPIKDNSNDINKIKRKMKKLKDLYLEDLIEKKEYENDYIELKDELDKLTSQPKLSVSKDILKYSNVNIPELYKTLTRENKRSLWSCIIEKIIIDENKEIHVFFK